MNFVTQFIFLLVLFAVTGCAKITSLKNTLWPYHKISTGEYKQKTDNFLIILDASGSMIMSYKDASKFDLAKQMVRGINETTPDLSMKGGLRVFGRGIEDEKTSLIHEVQSYTKEGIEDATNSLIFPNGDSLMGLAINAAREDLLETTGNIAVIIISDGEEINDSAVDAAHGIKDQYGDRLCLYTIHIGDDKGGKRLLDDVKRVGRCGFSVNADDIVSGEDMAEYVTGVFLLTEKSLDSDGDGVIDSLDLCPDTPKGAPVDEKGCMKDSDGDGLTDWDETGKYGTDPANPDSDGGSVNDGLEVNVAGTDPLDPSDDVKEVGRVTLEVRFELDSDEVETEYYVVIQEAAIFLEENTGTNVVIEGHTDSQGSAEYNLDLSARRAESVAATLVEHFGIEASRVSSAGYGLERPVATNNTAEGRAKNRRINAVFQAE